MDDIRAIDVIRRAFDYCGCVDFVVDCAMDFTQKGGAMKSSIEVYIYQADDGMNYAVRAQDRKVADMILANRLDGIEVKFRYSFPDPISRYISVSNWRVKNDWDTMMPEFLKDGVEVSYQAVVDSLNELEARVAELQDGVGKLISLGNTLEVELARVEKYGRGTSDVVFKGGYQWQKLVENLSRKG